MAGGEEGRREIARFTVPAPPIELPPLPWEERLPTDVPMLALFVKTVKLLERAVRELEATRRELEELRELVLGRGDVADLTVTVEGVKVVEPKPGPWKSLSVQNDGPSPCLLYINGTDRPPVQLDPGTARAWGFLTDTVRRVVLHCEKATVKLEFLR